MTLRNAEFWVICYAPPFGLVRLDVRKSRTIVFGQVDLLDCLSSPTKDKPLRTFQLPGPFGNLLEVRFILAHCSNELGRHRSQLGKLAFATVFRNVLQLHEFVR